MKLNTKTQVLNVVSKEDLAKLMQFESFTLERSDVDGAGDDYHLGAYHAFSDALDMIETQDVTKKTAVDGRLIVVVTVVGAAIMFSGPIKRFAVDVKKNYQAKRAAAKMAKADIVQGEVITPNNSAS